ncbi:hypothetical protein [Flavobacterium aquicola]|uniref:Uncharacterized protein n=1 Tax=Flavobacterium aquicola TaxID=1682742 RepID=A0A3E0ERW0_9FLAO|nr:hypothetical protein [Flavobacterium aquicola]REH00985.1 hypothetical protein C8P67_102238 [Flavobacterium aquicola]
MKFIFTINRALIIALVSLTTGLFSQTKESTTLEEIDPRQYLTVLYQKTTSQGKFDTIWNWESNKIIPNQKFNYIDVNGEIKIDFAKTALISNKDFEGTISLEAEISGENGTRKIEVNPYSEIGVERIPIGIKSEPPFEIAKKLLNMFLELKDTDYSFIEYYGSFTKDDITRKKIIEEKNNDFKKLVDSKNPNIRDVVAAALEIENYRYNDFYSSSVKVSKNKLDDPGLTVKEIKNKVETMLQAYNEQYNEDRAIYINTFKRSYNYASTEVSIVLDYLNSFESGGEDATKAFLSLINKDLVGYNALKKTLIDAQKKLSNVQLKYEDNDPALELALLNNAELITETYKSLFELSKFKGSPFEKILMATTIEKNNSFDETKFTIELQKREEERKFNYIFIENNIQELSEKLSVAAGKIIYKKLVYATIDLGKSGAKSNEVLNLYVTWILDAKKDKMQNSPRLPIGKYYIRETGWKTEITDMFALIKRQHESDVDQSTVSPSNFKGSGGVVLMWTYNKEDRGIEKTINKETGYVTLTKKRKFVNFLEPSIGLNVSYLDFSTAKDVEIGTGLQVGLFKNKIFFGYGVNLHMISPKDQSPTYLYVGFSFAKLSDLFKNSGKIVAN